MEVSEYHEKAREVARTIIGAYGPEPAEYDDAEQQIVAAFAYGANEALAEEAGVKDWEAALAMMSVLCGPFGFSPEMAGAAVDYFSDCALLGDNELMETVIQAGADAYHLLDQPADIARYLGQAVAYLRKAGE